MNPLEAAQKVIECIVREVKKATLSRTTYCALVVVRPADEKKVLYVAEAGKSAKGIPAGLLAKLQAVVDSNVEIVIGAAAPIEGDGNWHMNDAEQQALAIAHEHITSSPNMRGAEIMAVKATRDICESCRHTLRGYGLRVNHTEAYR